MHTKNIQYIIEHGSAPQMEQMKDVLSAAVTTLKKYSCQDYLSIEYQLHNIAHGGHLGEYAAKCWVSAMENKNGTKGEHWTWEQTEQVRKDNKLTHIDPSDWYAILNMTFSDYYNSRFDTTIYVELAKDWLCDSDVEEGKALRYYYFVVKA